MTYTLVLNTHILKPQLYLSNKEKFVDGANKTQYANTMNIPQKYATSHEVELKEL